MKRFLIWAAAFALLLGSVLCASADSADAPALPEGDPLIHAELGDEPLTLSFIPPANSEYAVYLFSADGQEVSGRARLLLDGEEIAAGAGRGALLSAWLAAGERYALELRGGGSAIVEIARSALSRCQGNPLALEENKLSGKMIARAYDAHWYTFEAAETGRMMLTCVPEDAALSPRAILFDETGARIAEFEALPGGACMLFVRTEAGKRYFLRVCAPGGQTGYYTLDLHRGAEGLITSALRFTGEQSRTLAAGSAMNLSETLLGEALLWVSDAPEVAAVGQDGRVTGIAPGVAFITAYGMSSQATCPVEVVDVPLRGLRILNSRIQLRVGDEAQAELLFIPQNASNRAVRFSVADAQIASVSEDGVITALSPGETTLVAADARGEIHDSAIVSVEPAERRFRALLVGEQSYPFGVNATRTGSENSVNALAALLDSGRFGSTDYAVRTGADLSKGELIAEIRSAFRDASAQDVSLFYITCHGNYSGGMSFLELSDGAALSARDLERELRRIPGTVIVMIDCCGSGGAIGAASERIDFARGITGAFSGAAVRGSKYKVLASAGLDQDSFRLAFNQDADDGLMATVFMRALCDGAGWDIDRGARGTMGADANYDGVITMDELAQYMAGRVNWYLERASELTGDSYRQSVQVYPEGDPFAIFS